MHGGILLRSDGAVDLSDNDPAFNRKNQLSGRYLAGHAGHTHSDTRTGRSGRGPIILLQALERVANW
jgi:hypothetical protein